MNTPNYVREHIRLWARRLALRWARKLVDLADDRLHAAEVRLRDDLAAGVVPVKQSPAHGHGAREAKVAAVERTPAPVPFGSISRRRETFSQWDARRSGVAPVSKKEARRRRRAVSGATFDLRFSERVNP